MKQSENNKEQQPAPQQKGVQGNNAPDNTSGSGDNRQAKINLPTGGGAVRGIGEKFQANPVTGTASFTVPLTISEGRGGFSPQLALSYDSGSGNSAFGLGWNVGLPSISRKTDKGLPQYNDNSDNESDTFILSDAEDLVPVWDGANRMCRQSGNYEVYTYQPRTEGLFALIERWKNTTNGISHWRTISKENIVSVFGFNAQARIADPDNPQKIFSWLLEESWDTKGNLMRFSYKQEDDENVEKSCYEKHRLAPPKGGGQFPSLGGVRVGANKYLKEIAYGNETMCLSPLSELSNYSGDFHFRLLFDYGEHIDNEFIPNDTWLARQDAFSNYKAGFEIRTYRLCRRVLMFHSFAALGQSPVLVRSTDLEYEKNASFSLLKSVTHKGYEGANQESLPPLDFTYTQSQPADCFKEVEEHMLRHLPAGIDGQNYQWADLYSEGVSGILTMNNQAWYFAPPTPPEGGEKPRWGGMKSEVP
ncbi:MAG: hypothetical protein FWH36_08725, partial [Lentimicrobiaceae bacterium]|nr:hypothetical protein [Lentimicrobiaceae bacterium]